MPVPTRQIVATKLTLPAPKIPIPTPQRVVTTVLPPAVIGPYIDANGNRSVLNPNLLVPSINNTGIVVKQVIAPAPAVIMAPPVSVFKPDPPRLIVMPPPPVGQGVALINDIGQSAIQKAANVAAGLQPSGALKEVVKVPAGTIAPEKLTASTLTLSKINPLYIGGILLAMIAAYFLFIKK